MAFDSAIDDAGHAYQDLRSGSRPVHRRRKHVERYNHFKGLTSADLPSHPSQKSHYLPVSSLHPSFDVFPADLSTAPVAKFTKREAYLEAQFSRPVIKHHSYVKDDKLKWAKRRHDRRVVARQAHDGPWEGREDMWWDKNFIYCFGDQDVSTAYALKVCSGPAGWEAITGWEEWVETGELFTEWAQRRINEMRAVKEERLWRKRQRQAEVSPSTSASTSTSPDSSNDDDEGYHSSTSSSSALPSAAPATTLPTTKYDMYGHELLHAALTPRGRNKRIKFPTPFRFYWFGEYEWYWHRNMTGCWFLTDFPCDAHWISPCCCEEFAKMGAERWDPEAPQLYLLETWLQDGWAGEDNTAQVEQAVQKDGDELEQSEEADDWDVISVTSASSEAWTEVPEDLALYNSDNV